MKLLIDDANIEKIKKVYEYYAVDGVTTNPSILAKNGKNPVETSDQVVLNTNNMQIADACCLAAPSFAPFSSQENFLYG